MRKTPTPGWVKKKKEGHTEKGGHEIGGVRSMPHLDREEYALRSLKCTEEKKVGTENGT